MELSLEQIEALCLAAYEKGRVSVVDMPEVVKAGWDESLHPRGDDGRFINKDEISAAAKSPAKAAELRKRVTDPAERGKLNAAIGDAGKANRAMGSQYSKPPKDFGAGLDIPTQRPGSREPLPTDTTGRAHHDRPDVLDTVNMARQMRRGVLDQSARGELAKRLEGHTADELRQIKSELGLRATGRKAELAAKILMAAAGHEYPEQGFTGALPVNGQGVHHYEDGQLVRIEKYPAEVHASRVTPDEAHAVIEYYQSKGLLTSKEAREKIAYMLMHRMSYRDISDLKRKLGLKASGRKVVYAQRIQHLVEDRERRDRMNPDHPANLPDPAGTMGSLAERRAWMDGQRALYGPGNSKDPARQEAIHEAADRLRMAVKSPFAAFNREAALGEAKAAVNDLYHSGEFTAAAHMAGIPLDPKDGTLIQQVAASLFRLAGGDASPLPQKPTNLLDGLGSEQAAASVPSNHTHAVVGDTYPHRDAIKRAGGTWDKVAKQWTIDEEGAQYLPDGLTAEPMAHRMPKTDTAAKPEETKTLFDQVKDSPAVVEPAKPDAPTIPDDVRKKAEQLKQWHQKASRHPVEYEKMLPWTADMIREGDAKQRADVAKRMGALIRKHPELFDEYGPYLKQGPNLPTPPTPEEHLAKHGADADPHQVVDDYMALGGHPNDLRAHLNPESANEKYSNRTGLTAARGMAINEVKGHLAGKAAPTNVPTKAGENASESPAISQNQPTNAPTNPPTEPDRAEELERERQRGIEDLERLKYGGKTKAEHQEHVKAESARQQAEAEKQYAENIKNPEWVEKQIADHKAYTDRLSIGHNSGNNSADRAAHERYAASLRQEHAAATSSAKEPDPTPGRTDHLQAVASAAGHDELRDAADTVARIEDIPHGERTADDRAELKRAKELAAAGGAGPASSTGAKNPAQYVDDHPEVTADNPLGLPKSSQNTELNSGNSVALQAVDSQPVSQIATESPKSSQNDSVASEPDSHAAKLADLESKMAEAKAGAANKSNGKGDRLTWERHHDELEDQHNALTGRVRTLAEHDSHVARAKKRKDHSRVAKLDGQEPAVHAQHIDNHLKRLDRRIAKMDEANTWAAHVSREHGKVKWDGEMETVYGSPKEAIEAGFPKQLIADESKGETGSSIDQIAQGLERKGDLQIPVDRNATDYLIEKLSSGETFDGGHDEHRQKLAAERDAIHSERDGKPETDAAIVATLREGKTPKGKAKPADVPVSTGSVTESPDTPKVPDVKQHSLDEIMGAAAGQDKPASDRPKHNYPRNPDGSFAEIHGAYSGQEKRPVKGNGVASDNRSTNKEKEKPAPREWTPEEIERKKRDVEERKQWSEMQNTIGKFKWLGDNPNSKALQSSAIPTKQWREFAESIGPEKISQIVSKLEPMIHGEIDAQLADDDGKAWFKNHLKEEANYYRDLLRGGKGHEKKVPNSHYAMQLLSEALDTSNVKGVNNFQRFKSLHDVLAPILKQPDAPDTSTSHGKPSAVPIGVTQKDDFESRGRGVRKSAAIESHEYLLPL